MASNESNPLDLLIASEDDEEQFDLLNQIPFDEKMIILENFLKQFVPTLHVQVGVGYEIWGEDDNGGFNDEEQVVLDNLDINIHDYEFGLISEDEIDEYLVQWIKKYPTRFQRSLIPEHKGPKLTDFQS